MKGINVGAAAQSAFCYVVEKDSRELSDTYCQSVLLRVLVIPAFLLTFSAMASVQTTYHLHDDLSGIRLWTTGPDTTAVAILSQDTKKLRSGLQTTYLFL